MPSSAIEIPISNSELRFVNKRLIKAINLITQKEEALISSDFEAIKILLETIQHFDKLSNHRQYHQGTDNTP